MNLKAVTITAALMLFSAAAQAQGVLYMVADEGDDALYTVDTTTGLATKIGSAGSQRGNAEGLAPGSTPGVLFSVNNSDDLDLVNADGSGFVKVGSDIAPENCDRGLAYNSVTGILYGSDNRNFCSIDTTTAVSTRLADPLASDTEGLAADTANNYIYGIDSDENLVRYDVGADSWTTVGPTTNISSGNDIGLAYDPDLQTLYAVDNAGILYSVNAATGLATEIGDTGVGTGLDVGLAFVTDASGTARFKVTKTFSDGSTDEVDVTLTCNSGLPLEQTFTIAGEDPDGVTFVVTDIPEGGADCEVTESGGPGGYTTELNGGEGCSWADVTGGFFECAITNNADPASYTVTKDWEIFNDGGDLSFDDEVSVTISCDTDILTVDGDAPNEPTTTAVVTLGDGESTTITVDTTADSTACSATEDFTQSGVEPSSEGCGKTTLDAGGSHTCAFTNTVFFEGIPTLSQYGLAILVLLTLGLGLVGVRRFA